MNIIELELSELKPYERNPRNNKEAVKYVAESIKQFGFKVPIVIDKDNVIIAGHTRYSAAKKLKLDKVPCIKADDLTEEQVKAYRLADNKVSEKSTWDFDLLSEELENIFDIDMSNLGFENLLGDIEEVEEKPQKDLSDELKETFEVIIKCKSELEQEEVFYRLTKEGYDCRVLTL